MKFSGLYRLSKYIIEEERKKPIFVFESKYGEINRINVKENIDIDLCYEHFDWNIPKGMQEYIDTLNKNTNLSNEEKILDIYKKICEDYTYDDNVLSYIRFDGDTYELPDFYGKKPEGNWNQIRDGHNRRSCFEVSRILAKSLSTMLKKPNKKNDFEVCVVWDYDLAHYLVGLVGNDYCLTLDVDDFEQIKDLTRIKTDLTIEGIKIFDDPDQKFTKALKQFNSKRVSSSLKNIDKFTSSKKIANNEDINSEISDSDDLQFIKNALEILTEEYELDSAGIFEYMKEIVDSKFGASSRKKVWKEVQTEPGIGKRYTRCLIINLEYQSYVIDVTANDINQMLKPIEKEEISNNSDSGEYFKYLHRDWEDKYDGR